MKTGFLVYFLVLALIAQCYAQDRNEIFARVPPEGQKDHLSPEDRDKFLITDINNRIEEYRLYMQWDTPLSQQQLEQARGAAFYQWARDHHSDLDTGNEKLYELIKNRELESNLGTVDLDWMATLGNRKLSMDVLGSTAYIAGKELWFLKREQKPDRSTFSSTYPDSNWRALAAADLLLSGKASVEEVFIPNRATPIVLDYEKQLALQRRINEPLQAAIKAGNDSIHEVFENAVSTVKAIPNLGGVAMTMNVDANSFGTSNSNDLRNYLCLSLKELALAAKSELSVGELSQQVAWLGGMTKIHALAPDPQNQDLVLVGEAVPGEAPIHLDDVAVLLRSAFNRNVNPYCSLDPKPKSILRTNKLFEQCESAEIADNFDTFLNQVRETTGPQMVVIGGVPRTSRAAHIMVSADYEMKQLSQGLISASNVLTSVLDRHILSAQNAIANAANDTTGSSMARFWFCMAPNQPSFGTNLAGVIWLEQCSVVVRTERQLTTSSGKLVDAHGAPDSDAEAFTTEFSENYSQISKLFPSMRALENLFRCQALFSAASYQGVLQNADIAFLRNNYPLQAATDMPDALPGLANGRVVSWSTPPVQGRVVQYTLAPVISGGVDMKVKMSPQMIAEAFPQQSELCAKALLSRPNPSVAFWRLNP